MSIYVVSLILPDGQQRLVEIEGETAEQAVLDARRDGRITYSDFVEDVRATRMASDEAVAP